MGETRVLEIPNYPPQAWQAGRAGKFKMLKLKKFFLIILALVLVWGLDKKGYLDWLRRPIESFLGQTRQEFYQPVTTDQLVEINRQQLNLEEKVSQLEKENQRLRELMGSNPPLDWDFALAHVIGQQNDQLILDIGQDQGVQVNQPVVLDKHLIGKIIQSKPRMSRVQLITHPNFQISAMIKSSIVEGAVKGRGGGVVFNQVLTEYNLAEGQTVVTSGQTDWPGLIIGQIDQIDKDESAVYQSASLKIFWQKDSLDTVFVIK